MTSILKTNTIQDLSSTVLLETNGSGTITTNNIGGQNTPAFLVYRNSTQSISSATYTKVQFNAEDLDTDK